MLFRLFIFTLLLTLLLITLTFKMSSKRKIQKAQAAGTFYFLDDKKNVRNNFLFTYKGLLFQGEKYTDQHTQHATVQSIYIWADDTPHCEQLSSEDKRLIEEMIHSSYPNAQIRWGNMSND